MSNKAQSLCKCNPDACVRDCICTRDANGHEYEARKRGIRMDIGMREREARSIP